MKSSRSQLGMILVALVGILVVAAGLIFLAALVFPAESSQFGLGIGVLVEGMRGQINAVSALTGLSLGADLLLLGAAYIMVCMFLWIQSELRAYFANRSHFE